MCTCVSVCVFMPLCVCMCGVLQHKLHIFSLLVVECVASSLQFVTIIIFIIWSCQGSDQSHVTICVLNVNQYVNLDHLMISWWSLLCLFVWSLLCLFVTRFVIKWLSSIIRDWFCNGRRQPVQYYYSSISHICGS